MRLIILFSGLLMGLTTFTPMDAKAEETATIRFIVTGDLYELSAENDRGGYAKLASVVRQEKVGEKHSYLVFLSLTTVLFGLALVNPKETSNR